MVWITENDLHTQIKPEHLVQLLGGDPTLLTKAEEAALEEAGSYLSSRYDVEAIWATTATARNAKLLQVVVDMVLYHLHSRLSSNQTPETRLMRYEAALDWLDKCEKGKRNPKLPAKATDAHTEGIFGWGSAEPRRRH
jgi:phage gp36-like protein